MIDKEPRERTAVQIVASLAIVLLPGAILVALQLWTGTIALALLAAPASVATAWALLRRRGLGWDAVGLRGGIARTRLLVTVPVATIVLLVLSGLLHPAVASRFGPLDRSAFTNVPGDVRLLLVWLVLVWTVAAFGEEMLFRGIVLNGLYDLFRPHAARWLAWTLALLVTSALFGAGHAYYGVTGIVLTGSIGLGFGLVYLLSRRNLWPAILTHGLYDTVGFLVLFAGLNAAGAANQPGANGL
jgi:membrane protease YdiL (CAAX protease family)